ncbi:FMN-dependent NADH-azoreductase [Paenibacillus apiarius]|uniref:FMN dependent NADH:quinone oxidoreductase n=1 Tax=Paenibacillus apiarius TaxID=46240 RepID=A0ABT4E244_9BACL|nr:FMN-dependent NADH-azoreductase [Paenibacillus apiarius]MCY9514981.1 FMN-dependent NADH-azoreductase [Paenibacillus apiarius]MCY9522418.1 FMN-dependent NADH-azoreductase [Paenibacillus apiarius]MCY9552162.1 FMN-dependent NADH-azoreductase [Paenibacillus apiarius]MCY9561051.1 FMN-dependent NADH-azoreductase [Paenibacillus apiarius]MCY9686308.1 FMN-dependent NADH-azoreductase [Paenibacillus apiarius]
MNQVLFVKANCRSVNQSVSVKLYHAFLENYQKSHPSDRITELDLYAEDLPYYDNDMMNGMYKLRKDVELSPPEQKYANLIMRYLNQFVAADKAVFAFPMWNTTVPAVLHTYMDYLNQPGKTYRYTPDGAIGLMNSKKVALLHARGGVYSSGPAVEAEMAVRFMKHNLKLFGIDDIVSVIVEGHNQYPEQQQRIIEMGIESAARAAIHF